MNNFILKLIELLNTYTLLNDYNFYFFIASKLAQHSQQLCFKQCISS